MTPTRAISMVLDEFSAATDAFKPFNSAHEGYSVLAEEVDELWDEVKKNPKKFPDRTAKMKREAVQVAAMALRFLTDLCKESD